MLFSVLSFEGARSAGIPVVENGRYTQALHEVVVAYRAARRSGSANSKSKADVNLSGAKPWRQKGTGRARAGYKSSPVWVGGGVVFGPKPRSYRKDVCRSVRRLALVKALSLKIAASQVTSVSAFNVHLPKTKEFVALVRSITNAANVLVISDCFSHETYLAGRNVDFVQLVRASDVNAEDLLRYRHVVVTEGALSGLSSRTRI